MLPPGNEVHRNAKAALFLPDTLQILENLPTVELVLVLLKMQNNYLRLDSYCATMLGSFELYLSHLTQAAGSDAPL